MRLRVFFLSPAGGRRAFPPQGREKIGTSRRSGAIRRWAGDEPAAPAAGPSHRGGPAMTPTSLKRLLQAVRRFWTVLLRSLSHWPV